MYALVDCDAFYVYCERLFQPSLLGRPCVVLSNNDGCVVSRSPEAKRLGIGMGQPFFQLRQLVRLSDLKWRSSNYPLYGDLSNRVMHTLTPECDDIEIYSIDEAFLQFSMPRRREADLLRHAGKLRAKVARHVGIPVSVGLANTKTLAKLANRLAKNHPAGVFGLRDPMECRHLFRGLCVGKVWGIGSQYKAWLNQNGVHDIWQLLHAPEGWIRQKMGVVGVRLHRELRGIPCLPLNPPVERHHSVIVSRTFPATVNSAAALAEACAGFATRLGEKLRTQQLRAGVLTVFADIDRFRYPNGLYGSRTVTFNLPTHDTGLLVGAAARLASGIFVPGQGYKKAGCLATELVPESAGLQTNLFQGSDPARRERLIETIDEINGRFGRNALQFAAAMPATPTAGPSWRRRTENHSPRYTTRWDEILTISI